MEKCSIKQKSWFNAYWNENVEKAIRDCLNTFGEKAAKTKLASYFHIKDKKVIRKWWKRYLESEIIGLSKVEQVSNNEEIPSKCDSKATFSQNEGIAESVTDDVKNLDDLLKKCEVDLDVWEVEKYIVNKWSTATAYNDKEGKRKMLVQPLYQIKAWLKKKKEIIDINLLLQKFIEESKSYAPIFDEVEDFSPPTLKNKDCLYVLNCQDLHLSKLAFHAETGDADWDIRLAEKAYKNAIDDLMGKAPRNRIEEVVVIVGSDMLQMDNDKSQTTAGTYVDSDTRLSKAFDVCSKMLTDVIEKLGKAFKVKVVTFPGNHDSTVSLYLGYYLSAWFRNHKNVIVDNSPKSRKYVGYGKNLIGFDHGHEAKLSSLPLVMMRENQDTISNYKYFEILSGHLHKEASDEYQGVKVRIAPALCPVDRWHSGKGFIGNIRTSQGLLYQRENGIEAIYYSKPE